MNSFVFENSLYKWPLSRGKLTIGVARDTFKEADIVDWCLSNSDALILNVPASLNKFR